MVVSTRQGEFLSAYQVALNAYVERYKTLEDPSDPSLFFWTCNFDYERMAEMGSQWEQDVQAIKRLNSDWRDVMTWIDYANKQALPTMQEHFKIAGYDYEHIPAAPTIDHETPKRLKNYEQRLIGYNGEKGVKLHKAAIQVGQLIILSQTLRGEKEYTILVESTHLSFPFTLSCDGTKERKVIYHACVLHLASEWSKLTDWSQFMQVPANVRRALGEKAKAIYHEEVGKFAKEE